MNKAVEHQPNPKSGKVRVLDLVKEDLEARAEVGNERYGTYLETHNGRDGLWDLYQELLDASMYVRQVIEERDKQQNDLLDVAKLAYETIVIWIDEGVLRIGVDEFAVIISELRTAITAIEPEYEP